MNEMIMVKLRATEELTALVSIKAMFSLPASET